MSFCIVVWRFPQAAAVQRLPVLPDGPDLEEGEGCFHFFPLESHSPMSQRDARNFALLDECIDHARRGQVQSRGQFFFRQELFAEYGLLNGFQINAGNGAFLFVRFDVVVPASR